MSETVNPKDVVGGTKLPMHLWPESATAHGCLGMLDGALKYGRSNFRGIPITASEYVSACKRHLDAWFEGEEQDPDSELDHFCHALATLAIIVDAREAGTLIDDRQHKGGFFRKMINRLTPHVKRLKDKHKDKAPKHWTIQDDVPTLEQWIKDSKLKVAGEKR